MGAAITPPDGSVLSTGRNSGEPLPAPVPCAAPAWASSTDRPSETLRLHTLQSRSEPYFFAAVDAPVPDAETEGAVQRSAFGLVDLLE